MDKECLVMFWFVPFFLSPSPPEKKSQPVEWRSVGYDRSRFTLLCLARVSVPDSSSRSPCLYTPCTVFFFFFFFFFLSLSLSLYFFQARSENVMSFGSSFGASDAGAASLPMRCMISGLGALT